MAGPRTRPSGRTRASYERERRVNVTHVLGLVLKPYNCLTEPYIVPTMGPPLCITSVRASTLTIDDMASGSPAIRRAGVSGARRSDRGGRCRGPSAAGGAAADAS